MRKLKCDSTFLLVIKGTLCLGSDELVYKNRLL